MSVYSDDQLELSSDSFWEIDNYKCTVKRIDDGHRLCNDLVQMIEERCEIEKQYAKGLKHWSKKWNELIEKGPEYGTMSSGWKSILTEADRVCDLHLEVKDKLLNEVNTSIKQWQKDHYHKTMMTFKETKEADDGFRKAQKMWAKLYKKVQANRKAYHSSCKAEHQALATVNVNQNHVEEVTSEQTKKLQDRVDKCGTEKVKLGDKYDHSLEEINQYNPRYMEDMTIVFSRCQDFETQRMTFLKETLIKTHNIINLADDIRLKQIYADYMQTLINCNHEKDLRWWSNNHGSGMAMGWPEFQEWTIEMSELSKRGGKGNVASTDTVLVTSGPGSSCGSYRRREPEDMQHLPIPFQHDNNTTAQTTTTTTTTTNEQQHNQLYVPHADVRNQNGGADFENDPSNPFSSAHESEEEGWDTDPSPPPPPEALPPTAIVTDGVLVVALYDYDAVETDELSFKSGDVFYKVEDQDEQGWCRGSRNGIEGLYPANYVAIYQPE